MTLSLFYLCMGSGLGFGLHQRGGMVKEAYHKGGITRQHHVQRYRVYFADWALLYVCVRLCTLGGIYPVRHASSSGIQLRVEVICS